MLLKENMHEMDGMIGVIATSLYLLATAHAEVLYFYITVT